MDTSSERVFNGSGKGYLPAGTIGNRTHILSERLKAGTEFKRLKKGHRPAPMPLKWTHILSYKPQMNVVSHKAPSYKLDIVFGEDRIEDLKHGDSVLGIVKQQLPSVSTQRDVEITGW